MTHRWVRLTVVSLLGVMKGACSDASARPMLSRARESPEALVTAALEALAAEDQAALEELLVTREEYERLRLLWPEIPDGEYAPFDFVWSLAVANNRRESKQARSAYGGRPLEVVSVSFPEQPEVYQSFRLHPGVEVRVRRSDTEAEGRHRSFHVLVERRGW